MKIAIINYGAGNIQSIKFAIQRQGYEATLTNDPNQIQLADKVIFPGVGEASSAMQKLKASGLDTLIPKLRQPVLGICLGMQLMCAFSEEGQTQGLGIFDVKVKRFNNKNKVPQIQWNTIRNLKSLLNKNVIENSFIYMVHSYYAPVTKDTIAVSDYGGEYTAAFAKSNFYATQFHPEKSGKVGEQILNNFLEL